MHVVCNHISVLEHRDNGFDLIGRIETHITEREDILVHNLIGWLVDLGEGMDVGGLAIDVNQDLARLLVETLGEITLHVLGWSDILESTAVKHVIIGRVTFTSWEISTINIS